MPEDNPVSFKFCHKLLNTANFVFFMISPYSATEFKLSFVVCTDTVLIHSLRFPGHFNIEGD